MAKRNGVWLMGMLLALLCPLPSFAGMALTVSSNGDGVFYLTGANVEGVEAIDITVDYDTTFLANPELGLAGGTFTSISTDSPGKISAHVVRESPDAGFDLDIRFVKSQDSSGVINYVTATMKDTEGRSFPVPVTIIPPPPPPVTSPANEPNGKADTASAASAMNETRRDGGGYQGGSVGATGTGATTDGASSPKGTTATPERYPVADRTSDAVGMAGAAGAAESAPSGDGTASISKKWKSVLQRFCEYTGKKKGVKEFAALFERSSRQGMVQEPTIALSDGKTPVMIKVELEPAGNSAPNFAMSSARFVSLHRDGEKSWVMTVVPNEGTWEVRLILRTGKDKIEFPLVVAPRIKILDGINEKNFHVALNAYLSKQSAGSRDESGPDRRYLHEYIFTANYLAKQATTPAKMAFQ